MRFIHTSDWHLGRLFHGRHLTEDQAHVLEEFHRVVRDARPDAVVIAGDIYDRAVPPTEAVELLDDTLARLLLDGGVPVILIAGNHDSPERIGFGGKVLARQGLHVAGTLEETVRPVVLRDAYGAVYFVPFTYAEPALVRNLFGNADLIDHDAAMRFLVEARLKLVPAKARKVAIAHAFIAGSLESESERPLSVGGSGSVASQVFAPFDYTALGHLHNAQQAGAAKIRYAGSLLKYSFDEARHTKGIHLVELDETGSARVETIHLRPKHDVRKVEGYFDEILTNRERYPVSDDYMMVTLRDQRAILDVHGQLEKIYPNLMQIERPCLHQGGRLDRTREDYRTKSESQLFDGFYRQMTGEALSDAQRAAFAESLDALMAARREVKL